MLHRHEKTCEAKVRFKFPGGVYRTPPTIFELLEDEGFTIPQHLKYFPYRATFDFECMFNSETGLNDTKKLNWKAKHIPVSVSVCSNVPNYSQPKCFVSNGNSTLLVKNMVDYLVDISKESYRLMKQEFDFLFQSIDEKLGETSTTLYEEKHRVYEISDEEGEDIMETDSEEEELESETEEDREFLDDDEEVEEQGPSFYRALDRQRERHSDDDDDSVQREDSTQEHTKKKVNPLKKMREKLEDYLKELPVVGFNSGKYDLNAVKEFLFPVLLQNESIQFTIKRNNGTPSIPRYNQLSRSRFQLREVPEGL